VVAIAVIFVLSGLKILNEYERSVVFRLGRLVPYRVRLRPWIRCATAAAERSLTRLCDPGSIPPMLTERGPNGRLRVLCATIVLLRLVSPDQRKIVGYSNRVASSQDLNPDILVMQPAQNWYCCDGAELVRAPKIRRILVQ
jgi:hypothetical protein